MYNFKNIYYTYNPIRVVVYARSETGNADAQIAESTKIIEQNPEWTLVGTYTDENVSTSKCGIALNHMLEDAMNGKFDLVVTRDISRFSRSDLKAVEFTEKFLNCGVNVFFVKDNINTLDPDGYLKFKITCKLFDEAFRRHSERVKAGIKAAKERKEASGSKNS